ncbi:hypothetical protein ZEAMMB73_Zm00001d045824 [Zea mays]|jgi:hypothetical protein|uniref:Uncharacterized protein n=1 Tax=Zea mays TaxID=4577 RepID=A0A1D6NZF4_MAIZE|nr:hypothetical protein ZEAMMB73_Zm00001d045824 [Zea mays]
MALRHEGEAEGEWPDHQQAARAKGRGDHQRTSTTMEGTQMAMSRMWTRLPHPTRGQKKLERLQRSDFDAKHQSSVNVTMDACCRLGSGWASSTATGKRRGEPESSARRKSTCCTQDRAA